MANVMKNDQYTARTTSGAEVAVIGQKPQHSPYLRIESPDGTFLGTIDDVPTLRRLGQAIAEALGD